MQWEYLQSRDLTTDDLNKRGLDGWELVSVFVTRAAVLITFYIFKRPLQGN